MSAKPEAVERIKVSEGLELLIVRDFWNPLIRRRELDIVAVHIGKGTPPRSEIRDIIARRLGVDPSLVVVRKLETEFGIGRTRIEVHVYKELERLKAFEPEYILKRHEAKKEEAGGE